MANNFEAADMVMVTMKSSLGENCHAAEFGNWDNLANAYWVPLACELLPPGVDLAAFALGLLVSPEAAAYAIKRITGRTREEPAIPLVSEGTIDALGRICDRRPERIEAALVLLDKIVWVEDPVPEFAMVRTFAVMWAVDETGACEVEPGTDQVDARETIGATLGGSITKKIPTAFPTIGPEFGVRLDYIVAPEEADGLESPTPRQEDLPWQPEFHTETRRLKPSDPGEHGYANAPEVRLALLHRPGSYPVIVTTSGEVVGGIEHCAVSWEDKAVERVTLRVQTVGIKE